MAQHVPPTGLEKEHEVLGLTNRIISDSCALVYKQLRRAYRIRDHDPVSVESGFAKFCKDPALLKLSSDEQIDVLERIVLGVQMYPNAIPILERHCDALGNVSKARQMELKASCRCGIGFE